MPKCKTVAGGYKDSSDFEHEYINIDIGIPKPPAKCGKQTLYAPPRITTAPMAGLSGFQLPRSTSNSTHASATPSSAASSACPTPMPELNVPEFGSEAGSIRSSNTNAGTPASRNILNTGSGIAPAPSTTTHGCSTIALERVVNELAAAHEAFKISNDEQHKRADKTLTHILDLLGVLVHDNKSLEGVNSAPILDLHTLTNSAPSHL
ncbi:hypothetical protein FS749_007382 [Ceratobasidium sp. UAMH 11750]|nr:hypothetical protein FS749_007382 [Ceratobasidium sp. UAMH 11750]